MMDSEETPRLQYSRALFMRKRRATASYTTVRYNILLLYCSVESTRTTYRYSYCTVLHIQLNLVQ